MLGVTPSESCRIWLIYTQAVHHKKTAVRISFIGGLGVAGSDCFKFVTLKETCYEK